MSQIPISALESGRRPTGELRTPAASVPRVGISGSLGVFGIEPAPPTSGGLQQARRLMVALGIAGETADTIGRELYFERRDREQEQAKIDALYDGQSRLDARTKLPELLKQENIDALMQNIPDGVPVSEYVDQILSRQLDAVDASGNRIIPDAYAKSYRSIVQPALTNAIVNRHEQIKADNTAELLTNARYADNPQTAIAEMRSMGIDVPKRKELEVVANALRDSAESGSSGKDRFNRIANHMTNNLGANELVDRLRPSLESNIRQEKNQNRIDTERQAEDIVASAFLNGGYDSALEELKSFRQSNPSIRPSTYAAMKQRLESAIEDRNDNALLTHADNLDRTEGISDSKYRNSVAQKANELGISTNKAYAMNNSRLIEKARTLANTGDVNGISRLESFLTNASSDEKQMFSDAATQGKRVQKQMAAEQANIVFRQKVRETEQAYMRAFQEAYNNGAVLDAVIPTSDQTIEIDGREHTFRASELRKMAHQWVLGAEDTNYLLDIAKVSPRSLKEGQTLYDAAANEVGGEGVLDAKMLSNRARLVDKTGIADPQITQIFKTSSVNRIPVGMTPDELGPEAAAVGDLFDQLDRLGIAKMHMDSGLYNRLSVARVNLSSGRAPDYNTALVMAAHPPSVTDTTYTLNDDDFDSTASRIISDMGIERNVGAARKAMLETANEAIRAGADRTAALEYATNLFQRDNVVVNGSPVYHNGVGVTEGTIVPLFDGLKDYIEKTNPKAIQELPTGDTSNLIMWRDPGSGLTRIMDASGHMGPLLDLTDEQLKVIAQDFSVSANDTALFMQDIRKQNRNQRWANGEVLLSELPKEIFKQMRETFRETQPLTSQGRFDDLSGAGVNVKVSAPTPPIKTNDPKVRDITNYLRTRETFKASESIERPLQQQTPE